MMDSPPLFDPVLMGHVNENAVGEFAPGELICVGPIALKARRPGWNLVWNADDGRYYPVVNNAGQPLFPPAHFPPELVPAAAVDRSQWDGDVDTPLVVGALPG